MADISVSYEEPDGSCSYSSTVGGRTGTRIFNCDWVDAFQLVKELRGGYRITPGNPYETPAVFPYADDLFCSGVALVGFGKPGQSSNAEGIYIIYDKAKITATYAMNVFDYNPEDPEAVEQENITVSAEMATISNYEWSGDSVALEDKLLPNKIESTTAFSVTKFHVSALPDTATEAVVGKVNSGVWRGRTAEYVLFTGAEASRTITVDGAEDWEVTYNFLTKSHSWNKVYRDSSGNYEAVRTRTGHDPIYETNSFATLGV